jgi:oligopeptide/dipeptide ABC transporter ATP-binding protein
MRQRVVIAIALSCGPSLLLADEPTTALDVTVQAQILDLLAAAQADRQMGMILVSHDLGVAAGRTDDIAVMYAGKIVERAPTRSLFTNPRMPYTEALMASIPRKDNLPHAPLRAIPGRPPDLTQLPLGCAFAPRCAYVQEKCRTERPPLRSDQPGHAFACWYPIGRSGPDKPPAESHEKSAGDPTETRADDGHHRSPGGTPGDDGTTSELSSSGRGPS